jgi:hypothetical protein
MRKPTNLREADCCYTCKHFRPIDYEADGRCAKYNGVSVTIKQVCDDRESKK